jgi:hypothetical protein
MRMSNAIMSASGVVMSLLLAGNIYFVNRIIEKVDKLEETSWGLKQEILVLKITLENQHTKEKSYGRN